MKAINHLVVICYFFLVLLPPAARADGSPVDKNAAESFLQRRGAKPAESVAAVGQRIEALALQHGNEVFQGVKKIPPQGWRVAEQPGGPGEDAVAWLRSRPKPSAHAPKHGGKAPPTPPLHLVKKPGIAEPVVGKKLGVNAVRALEATGPQARQRLKMMVEGGELAKIGRSQEIFEVIAKYGDRAANFLWDHKGVLAGGTLLAGFLANPAPYLEGTRILAENVVRPVAEVPGQVAREVAGKANWTLLLLVVVLIVAAFVAITLGYWQRLFHRRDIPLVPARAAQEVTSAERTVGRNGVN